MTINAMVRNEMSPAMMRLASGNRVNSAADDAAGLAIIENMTSQIRGLDQGTRNVQDMQGMINTAEGGLDTVGDSLQRIRELSLQASNATVNPSQREMIQAEIGQLAQGIQQAVQGTQFNNMNLLDGTVQNANTAAGAAGAGPQVNINDMSSIAQAVTNFNVTGSFNISDIDNAINSVNSERANLGAMHNVMDHIVNSNTTTSINMSDARSRIQDADIPMESMRREQDNVMTNLQLLMQQQQQQRVEQENRHLLGAAAV